MHVPELERSIGIEAYVTRSSGIGGVIRRNIEDFMVEEVLVDGSKAEIDRTRNVSPTPLHSSKVKDHRNHHLLCILVKRDWDTFLALKAIGKRLCVDPEQIQIAGIKDANAVTAQFITIKNMSAKETEKVQVKDINIRPMGYFHSKLSSYWLLGNQFQITVRAIRYSESETKKRAV
ncbi:tRNA pseudouridine(13) synthase TruD, partial [Candidatus Bathyarchaeota archaeon]|nr:tRNA pseudouridine(13) synthase TruD [Candidatus Bathyarchaeota archaeon]